MATFNPLTTPSSWQLVIMDKWRGKTTIEKLIIMMKTKFLLISTLDRIDDYSMRLTLPYTTTEDKMLKRMGLLTAFMRLTKFNPSLTDEECHIASTAEDELLKMLSDAGEQVPKLKRVKKMKQTQKRKKQKKSEDFEFNTVETESESDDNV